MNPVHPPFIGDDLKPNVEVLGRFASAFDSKHSVKKTQLHLASRLRWDSFLRYLNWLQKNNHIASDSGDGSEEFYLTREGREMFARLVKFLEYVRSNKQIAAFSVMYVTIMTVWITQMNF
ncbi:MAG TPA: winged helix-turn-helix domain-containing protein [Candidatus Nitrosotalea sp.]|nr:winged helix-turn-helix domain-containing protein [Candidatus Nitrosotalea sp.]